MIFQISIYDSDGQIIRHAEGPEMDLLLLNVGPGEDWLPGHYDSNVFFAKGGQPVEKPPKPAGDQWIFDTASEAWIDPRTTADHQAALYAARAAASMDKSDLLIALVMAGMLPADEAEIAAGGIIPPTIQAVLDSLPPEVFPPEAAMVARIKWRTDNIISRVNPVIVLAAAALGVTDEQMDVLFGVQMPE